MFEVKPFVRILAERAQEDPDAPAITCGSETITRGELERRSNRLARAFQKLGVELGDFVTIGLPNSIEFFTAFFATWKVGAIPQPVSHKLPEAERAAITALANPALVLGFEAAIGSSRPCLPAGYEPDDGLADGPLPELVSPAAKAPTSGGSTGRPKLIVAGNRAEGMAGAGTMFGMQSGDCQLVPGPLYHNAPLAMSTTGLMMGHHLVVLPRFDAVAALEAIATYKVQWLNLVPTMMSRMARAIEAEPQRFDLSSIRVLWHMAAPCSDWLKRTWIDLLGPEKIFELYGGTEAQSMTTINGTEWLQHRGSVGKPIVGEMVIFDDDGKVAPRGQVGEIFMRRNAGSPPTYRYIGAEAREVDGWETLGDLGWMDDDGYVYISDRRTDMILSGGANIYPAEVEAAIDSLSGVISSAVVGLPDTDLGQAVHALVQVKPGVTEADILKHLSDRLVRYKIPRTVELVDGSLRDDAGKVRRSALRDAVIARIGPSAR